ncbi:hypothetical protein KKJ09_18360 [Xenorhabdus bovienii]|uniref:hypothetical protein n=1 Tax=Xenorhabdus bovienii TaxID=40576 RepID=UPI0023B2ACAB|nr:hypothetical protein [Xenorhabdus bovienii]MDE9484398.1 hypothetical protein [Xenorhabdus bovienii]MDE9495493.1 hypothetical protein [Xenorhabdus bovienii]MDE9503917.1 hypothetical protein [Xenorhabdus bovienii]
MVSLTVDVGDDLSNRLKCQLDDLDAILRLTDLALRSPEASVFEDKIKKMVRIALRYTEKCEKYRSELHGNHLNSE